jgi:hypothetical protein
MGDNNGDAVSGGRLKRRKWQNRFNDDRRIVLKSNRRGWRSKVAEYSGGEKWRNTVAELYRNYLLLSECQSWKKGPKYYTFEYGIKVFFFKKISFLQ